MKRHLLFKESETSYLIEENQQDIFDISKSDLKFDSLKFYNNIFKNAAGYQEILLSKDESISSKNASYICVWLLEIIENICSALNEGLEVPIAEEETILEIPTKVIKLDTLSACAGDRIYAVDSDNDSVDIEVGNQDADYAVKISGHSMMNLSSLLKNKKSCCTEILESLTSMENQCVNNIQNQMVK